MCLKHMGQSIPGSGLDCVVVPATRRKQLLCVCLCVCFHLCVWVHKLHTSTYCRKSVCTHDVGVCGGRFLDLMPPSASLFSRMFAWMGTEADVFLVMCLCVAVASVYRRCTLAGFVCAGDWRTSVEEGPPLWAVAMKEWLCSCNLPIHSSSCYKGKENRTSTALTSLRKGRHTVFDLDLSF